MSAVSQLSNYLRFARANKLETGRSFVQLLRDLSVIVSRGITPSEYYRLSMYEGVPPDYVSVKEYVRIERILNPRQTGVVNFDKWHQYCFFKGLGLPTPEVFGFVSGKRGMLEGRPFSGEAAALFAMLDRHEKPVVIKPFGGGHGHGFDLLIDWSALRETLTLKNKGEVHVSDFLAEVASDPEGLIFQEHIKQHPQLGRFSASAVNTLRVLTVLTKTGDVEFPAVILKMAQGTALVDNVGAGGIASHMDVQNGRLGPGFVWPGKESYERHPESGAPIRGFAVPFWREGLDLAARAHLNLTNARSLGWDVAITEQGPLLLEMNSYVAIPVFQRMGHSVRHGVFKAMLDH
ncbi:hypothetical protein GO608_006510 [Aromatoleum buckelii]|nr:hypothetical protein [Aromatoleum buckelii]